MKSQNILRKTSLIILWSLLPFGKNKPSAYTDDIEPETGGQFKLYANYPNPFHTITMIYFSLMSNSHVIIDIFDSTGKKLLTLLNERMEAGVQRVPLYKVNQNASLPKGIYTYRLIVTNHLGKFSQDKFITVL